MSKDSNEDIIKHVMSAISNNAYNEEELEEKAKIFSLCLDIPKDTVKEILIEMHFQKKSMAG